MNKIKALNLTFLCSFLAFHLSTGKMIFEFNKNFGLSNSGFSAAILENQKPAKIPYQFILCSSHFQREVNTPSTHTIYVIYDDKFVTPWFSIGIWSRNILWANIENRYWYKVGKVLQKDFANWIHICLKIDIDKQEIETSVNGRSFNKTVLRKFQKVPKKLNLKIGMVHHSDIATPNQFIGKVSNIQILKDDDEISLTNVTKDLCKNREELSILTWSNMKWNINGKSVKFFDTDSSYICSNSSYIDLYVPFQNDKMTRDRGTEVCSKLGNGEISTLNHPIQINECVVFWTPYLFSLKEEIAYNEYSREPVSLQWCDGMPYNDTKFDHIVYHKLNGCYENKYSDGKYEYCTVCNSSLGVIYKMRGNCKYSILGQNH